MCVRFADKVLSFFLQPLIKAHPRLERFDRALREAVKDLIRPPEIVPVVTPQPMSGSTGVERQGMSRPVSESLPKTPHRESKSTSSLPEWLVEEWKGIHEIEPQLFPGQWLIENISFYQLPTSRIAEPYIELCNLFGEKVSHVFLVPWLVTGGADLVAINYIKTLAQRGLAKNIAVIATLDAESPWAKRLPEKVRFIEFGKIYAHLSPEEQEKLLIRVLLQKAPQVIHNIHSDLGYRVFVNYGKALSSISRLYTCSFCIDITQEGRLAGYGIWYLPKCFDYVEAVLSDNQAHLDRLHEIYAFDTEKLLVHYQPLQFPSGRHFIDKNVMKKERLDILWAGRLDRQKRPDILISIAEKCQELPFTFHVYGSPVLDTDIYEYELRKLDNIVYHGPFNGLFSVPTEDYDLFLYTSQWDGLPNVLLEAVSVGLPIIASNVGGVGELILHEKTGFLVDPFDDIDKYVTCIKRVNNDRSLIPLLINNAQALLRERHSWGMFVDAVKRVPGYILRNEQNHPIGTGELELRKK